MSLEFRGSNDLLVQRKTDSYSPSTGFTREFEYRGMDENLARRYAAYYAQNGLQFQLNVSHGISTLVATDTSGEVTIDTWEIGINQTSASSFYNPRNIAAVGEDSLEILARAEKDGSTISAAQTRVNSDRTTLGLPSIAFVNSDAAVRLRLRLLKGQDSFFYDQYVLRHTTNVSNRYRVNVSDQNKGRIYNQAFLISETTNSNSWIFPLPGRLVFKVNDAYGSLDFGADGTMKGWLKSASPESTAANNRVNIVTEYKLANIDTDEYAIA